MTTTGSSRHSVHENKRAAISILSFLSPFDNNTFYAWLGIGTRTDSIFLFFGFFLAFLISLLLLLLPGCHQSVGGGNVAVVSAVAAAGVAQPSH